MTFRNGDGKINIFAVVMTILQGIIIPGMIWFANTISTKIEKNGDILHDVRLVQRDVLGKINSLSIKTDEIEKDDMVRRENVAMAHHGNSQSCMSCKGRYK